MPPFTLGGIPGKIARLYTFNGNEGAVRPFLFPIMFFKSYAIIEAEAVFEDKSHIIYVNASIQDATELGQLMHDFHCKSADDMHSKVLADRVRQLKETTEGVDSMCREMEQIAQAVKVSVQVVQEWLSSGLAEA